MYDLNITQLTNLTQAQQVAYIAREFMTPTILIIFIFSFLALLIAGLCIVKGKESRIKFLSIWVLSLILTVIVITFFVLTPNSIIDFLKHTFLKLNT